MLIAFHTKAQGVSHKEKKPPTPCQDSAGSFLSQRKTVGIAVVADGHGGAKYFRSRRGAELAVRFSKDELWKFYQSCTKGDIPFDNSKQGNIFFEKNIVRVEQNIIRKWREVVVTEIKNKPLTDDELKHCTEHKFDSDDIQTNPEKHVDVYGTTLVAALIAPNFWVAIRIGDGKCVSIDEDGKAKICVPEEEDEKLGFGATTSLCASNAADNFKYDFGFDPIRGITVATDGVTDSFLPDTYLEFNEKLHQNFLEDHDAALKELEAFLPVLSEKGSRDDVSIAGIFKKIKEKRNGKNI
jgi:serine/threonine protein phosphatase PrpC